MATTAYQLEPDHLKLIRSLQGVLEWNQLERARLETELAYVAGVAQRASQQIMNLLHTAHGITPDTPVSLDTENGWVMVPGAPDPDPDPEQPIEDPVEDPVEARDETPDKGVEDGAESPPAAEPDGANAPGAEAEAALEGALAEVGPRPSSRQQRRLRTV